MQDILEQLENSSATENSLELQCRCFDAAEEIRRLRALIDAMRKNGAKMPVGDLSRFVSIDEMLTP